MGKPQIRLIEDGPREITFRQKTWYLIVNFVGFLLSVMALFIDVLFILPIGFAYGLLVNRFPDWGKIPLTLIIMERMPSMDRKECREPFNSRPFYRKR